MENPINIFVFPCGSEIALEIERSLRFSKHFHLIGGCSVKDHGRFVFYDIVDDLPWESDPSFISVIRRIIQERRIDLIFPAMDGTISLLKNAEKELGCRVLGSPCETTDICLSKIKTYKKLSGVVLVPELFTAKTLSSFPVFCKPEIGYGARGAKKINNSCELASYMETHPGAIICEFLPGDEYTVDCFTDRHGKMLFCGPRVRGRTMNGISVDTYPVSKDEQKEFEDIAKKINKTLNLRGAWFFQVKRNDQRKLCLLEVAARLGGSSSLSRYKGINLAELSIWDSLDKDVAIICNDYNIEVDRALDNKCKIDVDYSEVFVDFDDTVILDGKFYNAELMHFLFQCKNRNIKLTLLSRHVGNLHDDLQKIGLYSLFDRIICISKAEKKSAFIDNEYSIMIDDSFAERQDVAKNAGIPVFSLDMVQALIQ